MRAIVAAVLMAAAGGLAVAAENPTTTAKKVTWEKEVFPAFQKALKEGKPLVVVFTADWCEHCVKQNEMFEKEGVLDAYAGKAVFVKVDPGKDDANGNIKRLIEQLGIKKIPTVVVLDVSAEELTERGRVTGNFPASEFREHFGKVMSAPKGGKM
jgi:thiol:disulfide interchange protein